MTDETKRVLLNVLAADDVRWTWYKLDRALSARGALNLGNVAQLLAELAAEDFVVEGRPDDSPLNVYAITEKGRNFLVRAAH